MPAGRWTGARRSTRAPALEASAARSRRLREWFSRPRSSLETLGHPVDVERGSPWRSRTLTSRRASLVDVVALDAAHPSPGTVLARLGEREPQHARAAPPCARSGRHADLKTTHEQRTARLTPRPTRRAPSDPWACDAWSERLADREVEGEPLLGSGLVPPCGLAHARALADDGRWASCTPPRALSLREGCAAQLSTSS